MLLSLLVVLALLAALTSAGNPPWFPWGLHAAVVLVCVVLLLSLAGVK